MARALFYQPSCGLSGDMHLAACIDLGVPIDWLTNELAKLPVTSEYHLQHESASKMGISGTRIDVNAEDQHDHRHHSTIVKMIREAEFAPGVERRALDIFQRIADAEGKIHGVPPERVHFHEVGAVDSIVDIVGAALCIEYLNPDIILSAPIELGSGFVHCAHGKFPVPAPATQEILQGAPSIYGTVQGEATTPTGAAILKASVDEFSPQGRFAPDRVGYGIGHKDFEIPNVLRVALGEYELDRPSSPEGQHVQIEANIDDMSPEAFEPLSQRLFTAGAVDVFFTPIVMKKGRPAHTLTALCDQAHERAVTEAMLNHSSTIGVRAFAFNKTVLPREELTISTSLGEVRVKRVTQPNGDTRWKSEHDDVVRLAQSADLDYLRAKARIDAEIAGKLND